MKRTGSYYPLLLLLVSWLAAELLVNPAGEFPLNDDWAYAKPVKDLLNGHRLRLCDWQGMTLLSQVIWGYVFSLFTGFSFKALRFSTLLLSMINISLFYKILSDHCRNSLLLMVSVAALLFNPVYFMLSNSFMSEVPYMTFCLASVFFFGRYTEKGYYGYLLAACLLLFLAVMTRQAGIAIAFAFAVCWLLCRPFSFSHTLTGILPLCISAVILVCFEYFLSAAGNLPVNYNFQFSMFVDSLCHPGLGALERTAYYTLTSLTAAGVFLLPLFPFIPGKERISRLKKYPLFNFFLAVFLALVILKIALAGKYLPFSGNIIYHSGLGPLIMDGFVSYEIPFPGLGLKIFWIALTTAGAINAFLFLVFAGNIMRQRLASGNFSRQKIFFPLLCSLTVLFSLFPPALIYLPERYIVAALPFIILTAAPLLDEALHEKKEKHSTVFPAVITSAMVLVTVVLCHDYFVLQEVRWNALHVLTDKKRIPPSRIDGGYEYNAWHLFDFSKYHPDTQHKWWWVDRDDYIVTPAILPGHSLELVYPVRTWLPLSPGKVYVWKR